MRLRDLEAYFTKYQERAVPNDQFVDGVLHPDGIERSYLHVETLAEADGLWYLCPLCFKANGGPVGTHSMKTGFRGLCPPGSYGKNKDGVEVRWDVLPASTGIDDLQLSPSIQIQGGCNWHGFIGSNGVPPGEAA